jgi:SAM-dependent methyltransferase
MESRPEFSTTALEEGAEWGARAAAWAEHWGAFAAPAWDAVAEAAAMGRGTRILDVGCGSGEFCRMAAERGSVVSGIDAAEGMIEIARRLVPNGDFRVGAMELLPWADASFDLVTGFNAFQFAAEMTAALMEAKRVACPGGQVAICNWSRREDRELFAVFGALSDLQPPAPNQPSQPDPPAVGEAGVLEGLASEIGLEPIQAGVVDVPYKVADLETLERAVLIGAGFHSAIEHAGEERVRKTIEAAAAPFRQRDGSYRFENSFRYLVTRA